MSATPPSPANDAPLISLVLPVYNGERYLAESIQSCLDQTYPRWELLVVDDASTDATPDIVAAYAARDPRIRSFRHATNRRLPAALNTGFAQAHGEYLTWTSDDNRYHPAALAALLAAIQTPPLADFVYADYAVIDADGAWVQTNHVPAPKDILLGQSAIPCFLYTRALSKALGEYAEDLALAEDYDYWLRIYASGRAMRPLRRTLYAYRRHPRSLTDARRGEALRVAERALLRNLPALLRMGRSVRGAAYLQLAALASWRGDRVARLRHSVRAGRYTPLRLLARMGGFGGRRLTGA